MAARKKRGDKNYINNKEFTKAVILCKKEGALNNFVIECFKSLAQRAVEKLYFKDPRDREDCIQSAILDCLKYWKSFDETKCKNPNAFAYFTQVCKNGYSKEWKKIHRTPGLDKDDNIEFISLNLTGDSSIFSI